jgi:hypothetical protein
LEAIRDSHVISTVAARIQCTRIHSGSSVWIAPLLAIDLRRGKRAILTGRGVDGSGGDHHKELISLIEVQGLRVGYPETLTFGAFGDVEAREYVFQKLEISNCSLGSNLTFRDVLVDDRVLGTGVAEHLLGKPCAMDPVSALPCSAACPPRRRHQEATEGGAPPVLIIDRFSRRVWVWGVCVAVCLHRLGWTSRWTWPL